MREHEWPHRPAAPPDRCLVCGQERNGRATVECPGLKPAGSSEEWYDPAYLRGAIRRLLTAAGVDTSSPLHESVGEAIARILAMGATESEQLRRLLGALGIFSATEDDVARGVRIAIKLMEPLASVGIISEPHTEDMITEGVRRLNEAGAMRHAAIAEFPTRSPSEAFAALVSRARVQGRASDSLLDRVTRATKAPDVEEGVRRVEEACGLRSRILAECPGKEPAEALSDLINKARAHTKVRESLDALTRGIAAAAEQLGVPTNQSREAQFAGIMAKARATPRPSSPARVDVDGRYVAVPASCVLNNAFSNEPSQEVARLYAERRAESTGADTVVARVVATAVRGVAVKWVEP